jgi:general nucleoside transport system ATP-binding protein
MPSTIWALNCSALSKHFGAVSALLNADVAVSSGTIHALVGENGAGKSTLINIVSGLLTPDQGTFEVFGQPTQFQSPLDAVSVGIGTVHQHFLLAEAMTVAENIALGLRTSPAGWRYDRRRREDEVAQLSQQTGLEIDPSAIVADLPVGLRQRVEILKALSRGAKILLLDEPTAVLAPPEVETLFKTLRALRDAGRTIVIVTHKLNEVFALASEVTVLRRGTTVHAGPLNALTPPQLSEKMIGRESPRLAEVSLPNTASSSSKPLLHIKEFHATGLRVDDLTLHAGEIYGVAGVEGNGQETLAEVIAGALDVPDAARHKFSGSIDFDGQPLQSLSTRQRALAGIAFIPPDRQKHGLVLEMSLSDNLHLREPVTKNTAGLRLLDHGRMQSRALELLPQYDVRPPDPQLNAEALSGGNQQKVVIARELSRAPKLIVACNPTRGLDVGAAADVHQRLQQAARQHGAAVLLISSDLDEVLLLADRVGVLFQGTLRDVGLRGVSRDTVGQAMVGATASVSAVQERS